MGNPPESEGRPAPASAPDFDPEGYDGDALALLARDGHREAAEALVRRYQERVLGFAVKFLGQEAGALDAVQDAFLDVLRALPRYRPEGRFAAFLYRCVINRCRMQARSHRTAGRALDRLWREAAPPPADEVLARERRREVQRAVAGLSDKTRAVVLLRYWAGLSHEEIAEALSVPVGTVKSRLFAAMADLRREVGR